MLTPIAPQNESKEYKKATIEDGIELCKLIFTLSESRGLYPALTGGLIYKDGQRKDIDIVLYRHRQKLESFDNPDFIPVLLELGINVIATYGFVTKCEWKEFEVDIFNPESIKDISVYGGEQ